METDTELAILEHLYSSSKAEPARAPTQRRLAASAGLSLGMTNVLLKRFSDKGWVAVRRVNARNLHYALTPEGVQEIARRTYRYLRRTARNVSLYRDILEEYVLSAKRDGVRTLALAGTSDLDFILEYVCERHGLFFVKTADPVRALSLRGDGVRLLYAERVSDDAVPPGAQSLKAILTGTGAARRAEESE